MKEIRPEVEQQIEQDYAEMMDRRKFFKRTLVTGGALAAGATSALAEAQTANLPPNIPRWSRYLGPGVTSRGYGQPSEFEAHVKRGNVSWLTASPNSSISFTPLQHLHGIITPNGLHFERHHGGMPSISPEEHRLVIHGGQDENGKDLLSRPLMFTMDDLQRFPSESRIHFIECPANSGMEWKGVQMSSVQFTHGMISCCEWTGVKVSTLLQEAGIDPEFVKQALYAKDKTHQELADEGKDAANGAWCLAEGADAGAMDRSIPLWKLLDDAMIVYAQNGEALRPEQGYPIRLLVPGFEGNMNIKWIRRLKLGIHPWRTREETSKYTDLLEDGQAREFTWMQDTNSVITFPSVGQKLEKPGRYELRGLAWTGRGTIRRVDVSLDGGRNWTTAELQSPVLSKCLTRFRMPFDWSPGQTMMLQSRAMDETGFVQPTLAQLRDARGVNSIYHKNAIYTWKLDEKGDLHNVQMG
jgi:sulfane dehydrogenase subunit SoxC